MSEKYRKRITEISITTEGSRIYKEGVITVSIRDQGAGEYVDIKQESDDNYNSIGIDCREQWELVKEVVEDMLQDIKSNETLRFVKGATIE